MNRIDLRLANYGEQPQFRLRIVSARTIGLTHNVMSGRRSCVIWFSEEDAAVA
jgi:hypothetical protein